MIDRRTIITSELLRAYESTIHEFRCDKFENLIEKLGIFIPGPDILDDNWEKIPEKEFEFKPGLHRWNYRFLEFKIKGWDKIEGRPTKEKMNAKRRMLEKNYLTNF